MTAEVAVINSSAVALAADSAVTIGGGKIYNSALKVFSLSKSEPVGVMIYGNASLIGVPWETMIKVYRKQLGAKKFDTLAEYVDDFFLFLEKRKDFFPTSIQDAHAELAFSGYFKTIFKTILSEVDEEIKNQGKIDESGTSKIIASVIDKEYNDLNTMDFLDEMDDAFEKRVITKYRSSIKSIREEIFGKLKLSRSLVTKMNKIAAMLFTREIFSSGRSGFVVAGFGEKEIFPSIRTHEINGVILGRLKKRLLTQKSSEQTGEASCAVIPFAQDDMVYTFMQGINPSVHQVVRDYMNQLFARLPDLIDPAVLVGTEREKKKFISQYSKDTRALLDDFFDNMNGHLNTDHVQPVMGMVAALPKDELAAMAEALVNLTAFKRRLTGVLETVGGPIDVAVISKGDGLVWVKRKHYFPEELNRHFAVNYMRGHNA